MIRKKELLKRIETLERDVSHLNEKVNCLKEHIRDNTFEKEMKPIMKPVSFVVQLLLDYFNLELKHNEENYKLTLRKEVKKNENG